jgi:hypothetical protein
MMRWSCVCVWGWKELWYMYIIWYKDMGVMDCSFVWTSLRSQNYQSQFWEPHPCCVPYIMMNYSTTKTILYCKFARFNPYASYCISFLMEVGEGQFFFLHSLIWVLWIKENQNYISVQITSSYFTEVSHSWEATSRRATQEFPNITMLLRFDIPSSLSFWLLHQNSISILLLLLLSPFVLHAPTISSSLTW